MKQKGNIPINLHLGGNIAPEKDLIIQDIRYLMLIFFQSGNDVTIPLIYITIIF